MMINCNPIGICSWNFKISGRNDIAYVSFDGAGESGSIDVQGRFFTINKKGFISPVWNLADGSRSIATATKDSFMTRSFSVISNSHVVKLTAATPQRR